MLGSIKLSLQGNRAYLSGFVDGEECFKIQKILKRKKKQ